MRQDKYFASFDGAKIYYHKITQDKNKWLVFLHGFGGDLTAWDKEREYFTRLGISTIAMDLRGHGLSARSGKKDFYKLENFAKDVEALIIKERLKKPVIVGHCFGGMVTIYFEAQFPNRSQGLVLVDTSYKPPFVSYNGVERVLLKQIIGLMLKFMPDLKKEGHRNFNQFIGTNDLDARRIISDILHTSLKSYLTICDNLIDLNAKELLNKILVPTLVVEGSQDTVFTPQIAKYLSSRIKKSQLDLLPGANHILVLNNPNDLATAIEGFLKKIAF